MASPSDRPRFSRRTALGLGGAAVLGAALPATAPAAGQSESADPVDGSPSSLLEALQPAIRPRADWAEDLPVSGEIQAEEDVRFLLVHHTASTNDYQPDEVVDQIREFHRLHTGPEKGWPDVAYNFFVDRFGVIWEARAGSIDGPVRGDATGGSQGFALLCSLIGNHAEAEVTEAARSSLVSLLAWLAERHGIDTEPGATVDFTSRGSNRWPVGSQVSAATISGHRDMSETVCPGDFAYGLLATDLPTEVSAARALLTPGTTIAAPADDSDVSLLSPSSTEGAPDSSAGPSASAPDQALGPDDHSSNGEGFAPLAILMGAGATMAAALAIGAARFRRRTG